MAGNLSIRMVQIFPNSDYCKRYTCIYVGGACNPSLDRTWAPNFVCDQSTELSYGTVVELFGSCRYTLDIRTKYACPGAVCEADSSNGLSGGWIFIIIFLCAFFLYFVGGYIIIAKTTNKEGGFKDFSNNIPQRSFWVALPSLVVAGCAVSKEYIMSLINKEGDDGSEALTGNDED